MGISLTTQHRLNLLGAYVTDLELEVDRLRKQLQLVCQAGRELCDRETAAQRAEGGNAEFRSLLDDIRDEVHSPVALDRIVSIPIRELVENIFRWQQRLENRPQARLIVSTDCQQINWFPVRLRHVMHNLIANAMRYEDSEKGECRVNVDVRTLAARYELRVTDNGVGMPEKQWLHFLEPAYRASADRGHEIGVGLATVKHLVQQSGGELNVTSGEGMGSCFVVTLPMFEQGDFLE